MLTFHVNHQQMIHMKHEDFVFNEKKKKKENRISSATDFACRFKS